MVMSLPVLNLSKCHSISPKPATFCFPTLMKLFSTCTLVVAMALIVSGPERLGAAPPRPPVYGGSFLSPLLPASMYAANFCLLASNAPVSRPRPPAVYPRRTWPIAV